MSHMQSNKLTKAAANATQNQTPKKSRTRLTVTKRTTKMTTTTMMAMYSVSGCSAIVGLLLGWAELYWKLAYWELT